MLGGRSRAWAAVVPLGPHSRLLRKTSPTALEGTVRGHRHSHDVPEADAGPLWSTQSPLERPPLPRPRQPSGAPSRPSPQHSSRTLTRWGQRRLCTEKTDRQDRGCTGGRNSEERNSRQRGALCLQHPAVQFPRSRGARCRPGVTFFSPLRGARALPSAPAHTARFLFIRKRETTPTRA